MKNVPWFSVDITSTTSSALTDDELDALVEAGADVVIGLGPGEWRSVWGVEAATADGACRMALYA